MNRRRADVDTKVPALERFKWPKALPALSPRQQAIQDDFVEHWHRVLPERYGVIEKFNHGYPLRHLPAEKMANPRIGGRHGAHLDSSRSTGRNITASSCAARWQTPSVASIHRSRP